MNKYNLWIVILYRLFISAPLSFQICERSDLNLFDIKRLNICQIQAMVYPSPTHKNNPNINH